jgi:peptide/nickel transport system substrate-binding protein
MNRPGTLAGGVRFSCCRDGRVIKEALPTGMPKTSTFFVFNTRRAIFSDIRVREAISLLFDFEWINHSYFFDPLPAHCRLFRWLGAIVTRPTCR